MTVVFLPGAVSLVLFSARYKDKEVLSSVLILRGSDWSDKTVQEIMS